MVGLMRSLAAPQVELDRTSLLRPRTRGNRLRDFVVRHCSLRGRTVAVLAGTAGLVSTHTYRELIAVAV